MLHAEPLFLVDDHQAEPGEPGLRLQQLVRADDHVHRAVGEPAQRLVRLGLALETRQRPDLDRERRIALGERGEVLLDQQRGRHQHGDLLAVLHGLERGPHRDLGLAVAHVAADQPVHRHRPLHVVLDLVDGGQLVRGLHVRERILQLALPGSVRAEGEPGRGHPGRVEPDQLGGDLPDGLARPALDLGPVRPAEAVQRRRFAAGVPGHLVELVGGHVEPVRRLAPPPRRVLDDQVLPGRAGRGPRRHLHVPADAVLFVHHVVAGRSWSGSTPPRRLLGIRRMSLVLDSPAGCPARSLSVSRTSLTAGQTKPFSIRAVVTYGTPGLRRVAEVLQPGADSLAAERLGQPLRRAVALGDQHAPASPPPASRARP